MRNVTKSGVRSLRKKTSIGFKNYLLEPKIHFQNYQKKNKNIK